MITRSNGTRSKHKIKSLKKINTRLNYLRVSTRSKVVSTYFGTRSKVLNAKNTIIRTFDIVPKSVGTTLNTRSKVFIMLNNTFKTFDLVIKAASSYFGTISKVFKLIESVPVAYF